MLTLHRPKLFRRELIFLAVSIHAAVTSIACEHQVLRIFRQPLRLTGNASCAVRAVGDNVGVLTDEAFFLVRKSRSTGCSTL